MNVQAEQPDPEYGDLLIVDILRPDWRHFFSRYRTDLLGFVIVAAIIVFIVVGTKRLAMIGASEGRQAPAATAPAPTPEPRNRQP